jgi:hypothetical protein
MAPRITAPGGLDRPALTTSDTALVGEVSGYLQAPFHRPPAPFRAPGRPARGLLLNKKVSFRQRSQDLKLTTKTSFRVTIGSPMGSPWQEDLACLLSSLTRRAI